MDDALAETGRPEDDHLLGGSRPRHHAVPWNRAVPTDAGIGTDDWHAHGTRHVGYRPVDADPACRRLALVYPEFHRWSAIRRGA
ncbi:hypothetical protein [Actinocatenispora rupis]|uniref:Uncharacterized protein n=1 Tax=Actinocatenispora rupis TaxID=519421 RepID=A0A8J3N901_9ACTN|nr:hypothetical protein [Actinocatenispora rupis]GID10849.1 hypothetical protein Aru02nite_17380 [Actinocatenispora rupis]